LDIKKDTRDKKGKNIPWGAPQLKSTLFLTSRGKGGKEGRFSKGLILQLICLAPALVRPREGESNRGKVTKKQGESEPYEMVFGQVSRLQDTWCRRKGVEKGERQLDHRRNRYCSPKLKIVERQKKKGPQRGKEFKGGEKWKAKGRSPVPLDPVYTSNLKEPRHPGERKEKT